MSQIQRYFANSVQDKETIQWSDTFAFDASENLWLSTSRLQALLQRKLNLDEPNFRLVKAGVNAKSYMYQDWTHENAAGRGTTAACVTLLAVAAALMAF